MGRVGRIGRRAPGKDRPRSGIWLRQELRAELPSAGSLSGIAIPRLSAVGWNVKKIIHRTHAGERRKRRCRARSPLRKSRRSDCFDLQGCAHLAHARCEILSRGRPRGGYDPRGSLAKHVLYNYAQTKYAKSFILTGEVFRAEDTTLPQPT